MSVGGHLGLERQPWPQTSCLMRCCPLACGDGANSSDCRCRPQRAPEREEKKRIVSEEFARRSAMAAQALQRLPATVHLRWLVGQWLADGGASAGWAVVGGGGSRWTAGNAGIGLSTEWGGCACSMVRTLMVVDRRRRACLPSVIARLCTASD